MTALTAAMIARLSGTGLTSQFVADVLQIKRREAVALLSATGAKRDKCSRYFIPGTRSPMSSQTMCTPSEHTGSTLETGRDRW